MSPRPLSATLALICATAISLQAEVHLASPFSSHMVLQREMKVPVWGHADPGEKVTVQFAGQSLSTTATPDGKWRLDLAPMPASAESRPFTITGSATAQPIRLDDVLVGEVWLASGQSNMDFSMSATVKRFAGVANETQEIAAANYPNLRFLTGVSVRSYTPRATVDGVWELCTPSNAPAFSAVAYFFGRDLQKGINVPVGIVTESFGASTAESWIQREALAADPKLNFLLTRFDAAVKQFRSMPKASPAPARSEDVSAPFPAPSQAPSVSPLTPPAPGASPAAFPARRPRPRGNPENDQHNPTVLYNGMIAPIVPFAIRGVIWYQGESIVDGAAGRALYPRVQATLIKNWRQLWGEGNFPFYICQLAALDANSNSPDVREAQATVLDLPNTGMAVTIDIGEHKNVHPKDKQDVGDRLSRIALANVYGQKIEYSGPTFDSAKVENNAIRIHFTHVGGGLVAKGGPLKTFEIAGPAATSGTDPVFLPADAKIDGDTVVVSSPTVPTPIAARYAWANYPDGCNLYNTDGLPAPPFRTNAPPKPDLPR
jgi:sialate O-acetylesterase